MYLTKYEIVSNQSSIIHNRISVKAAAFKWKFKIFSPSKRLIGCNRRNCAWPFLLFCHSFKTFSEALIFNFCYIIYFWVKDAILYLLFSQEFKEIKGQTLILNFYNNSGNKVTNCSIAFLKKKLESLYFAYIHVTWTF